MPLFRGHFLLKGTIPTAQFMSPAEIVYALIPQGVGLRGCCRGQRT